MLRGFGTWTAGTPSKGPARVAGRDANAAGRADIGEDRYVAAFG
jgi:hypothetical protein